MRQELEAWMKRKILVVDDEPEMAQMLADFLDHAGYEVKTAGDGQLALDSVRETPPDLILMDILLPKMDGWIVCQKLKVEERSKQIPIILFSGMLAGDSPADPMVEKCDYLIAKPVEMQNLLQKIRQFLPPAA